MLFGLIKKKPYESQRKQIASLKRLLARHSRISDNLEEGFNYMQDGSNCYRGGEINLLVGCSKDEGAQFTRKYQDMAELNGSIVERLKTLIRTNEAHLKSLEQMSDEVVGPTVVQRVQKT